jgi:hypothetical protein
MSTAASLAAAKKRRGPQQNNINSGRIPDQQNNKLKSEFKQENLTPFQLLSRHEMRLYNLERLYTSIKENKREDEEEEYATKKDLEMLTIENNLSGNNAKLSNDVENSKGEISTLKNNIQSLTKTVNDMNSIIQNLKATIITQENEIKELKK